MAAKTALTPELEATFLKALSEGMWKRDAAALAGVTYHTVRDWELRGMKAEDLDEVPEKERVYVEFLRKVRFVEARFKKQILEQGGAAAMEGSNAGIRWAQWLLERRYPREYAEVGPPGMKREVEVEAEATGMDTRPKLIIDLPPLPPEDEEK